MGLGSPFEAYPLGSSSGCKWTSDARVRNASWDATEGWDPATGLGMGLGSPFEAYPGQYAQRLAEILPLQALVLKHCTYLG
jgi:hypothetical protein